MRVRVGPLANVPAAHCTAIAGGAAVVVRVDGDVAAFPNRCLHQDSPLAGGRVFDGRLTCPMHFWRYHLPDGTHTGGRGRLTSFPTEIDEHGVVFVDMPDPGPPMSLRERLLAHAAEWRRDAPPPPDRPI